jgi:hypothetical protein
VSRQSGWRAGGRCRPGAIRNGFLGNERRL